MTKKTYHPSVQSRIDNYRESTEKLRKLNPFIVSIDKALGLNPDDRDYKRYTDVSVWDHSVTIRIVYPHILASAEDLRALRAAGFFQKLKEHPPSIDKSDGEATHYLFHQSFEKGEKPVATLIARLDSTSPTCKRVKVSTRTYTQDVYEVRCDGKEIEIVDGQLMPVEGGDGVVS